MTGNILPQNVKVKFHKYCNCCKYLELAVKEESFTSDYHAWNEYTVSCEHYDACARAYDFKTKIVIGDPFKEEEV